MIPYCVENRRGRECYLLEKNNKRIIIIKKATGGWGGGLESVSGTGKQEAGWVEGGGTFAGRDMSGKEMKTLAFILQVVGNLGAFFFLTF